MNEKHIFYANFPLLCSFLFFYLIKKIFLFKYSHHIIFILHFTNLHLLFGMPLMDVNFCLIFYSFLCVCEKISFIFSEFLCIMLMIVIFTLWKCACDFMCDLNNNYLENLWCLKRQCEERLLDNFVVWERILLKTNFDKDNFKTSLQINNFLEIFIWIIFCSISAIWTIWILSAEYRGGRYEQCCCWFYFFNMLFFFIFNE